MAGFLSLENTGRGPAVTNGCPVLSLPTRGTQASQLLQPLGVERLTVAGLAVSPMTEDGKHVPRVYDT